MKRISRRIVLPVALVASVSVVGVAAATRGDTDAPSARDRGAHEVRQERADRHGSSHRFGGGRERGHHGFGRLDADVRGVLREIHAAAARELPGIATPIIDKAVADARITREQGERLREAADRLSKAGPMHLDPQALGVELGDRDVRGVVFEVARAAAARVPDIARPIVDRAVEEDRITRAEGERILAKLSRIGRHLREGRGRGRGGHPHFGRLDADVARVLRQVRVAVAREAVAISTPIIDSAVREDRITSEQGDQLRAAARRFAASRPGRFRPFEQDVDFADPDVRAVVVEVVRATAVRARELAGPIIDGAVERGTITRRQAQRIRERLERIGERAGHPRRSGRRSGKGRRG